MTVEYTLDAGRERLDEVIYGVFSTTIYPTAALPIEPN
jgi:hypothetical protein